MSQKVLVQIKLQLFASFNFGSDLILPFLHHQCEINALVKKISIRTCSSWADMCFSAL